MSAMKQLMHPMFGLVTALALAGCGQDASSSAGDETGDGPTPQSQTQAGEQPLDNAAAQAATELKNYVPASYPLTTCVVGGGDLEGMGGAVSYQHEGRTVWFCCVSCEADFEADPDTYLKRVDDAVVAQQLATYPLAACLISGDALGDEPINYIYENRLVRLCCAMCIETFLKNPEAYLATLNEAVVAEQMANYPITTCPIASGPLGGMGTPIDMVVGDRLVRLCCSGCIEAVHENPQETLDKVYDSTPTPQGE